jgi:hypothetical protein
LHLRDETGHPLEFIEADVVLGVRVVSMQAFAGFHCRISRPVNLSAEDIDGLIKFAVDHIGCQYDLKNIIDLARYLIPTPPVPTRWRRRMIALGSGDPTKATVFARRLLHKRLSPFAILSCRR